MKDLDNKKIYIIIVPNNNDFLDQKFYEKKNYINIKIRIVKSIYKH